MNLVFKLHVAKRPQTEAMGEYRPARFWSEQEAMTKRNLNRPSNQDKLDG